MLHEQSRYHRELADIFADEQKYDAFVQSLDDGPYSLVLPPASSATKTLHATLYELDDTITSYL